ncbi:MAG: hypothetical protein K8L99_19430 [Anaerolineae bacterium]|nr:hypothetical protein [Anaerolineae bacterium]
MQHLNTLWQVVNAASDLRDMTRKRQTYHYSTIGPITFYLQAEHVEVQVMRWNLPKVEIGVMLQASFGWRMITDQDEAGVYVVAKRRKLVGGMANAAFQIVVPADAFLVLKLEQSRLVMEQVNGVLNIPPVTETNTIALLPAEAHG